MELFDEFARIIFKLFNESHMIWLCLVIASINIYLSIKLPLKRWPRRVKAFNWILLAFAFLLMIVLDQSAAIERSWARLAFGLLTLGELAYYGDVIGDIVDNIRDRVKSL